MIPCHNPEFREQLRTVHAFVYRVLMGMRKAGLLSREHDQEITLALATFKRCEECLLSSGRIGKE